MKYVNIYMSTTIKKHTERRERDAHAHTHTKRREDLIGQREGERDTDSAIVCVSAWRAHGQRLVSKAVCSSPIRLAASRVPIPPRFKSCKDTAPPVTYRPK